MKFRRMSEVDLRGKRVFIRCDLNVPIEDGRITDDTRIRAPRASSTHSIGRGRHGSPRTSGARPKACSEPEDSLAPVAKRLGELLKKEVPLVRDWVDGLTSSPVRS